MKVDNERACSGSLDTQPSAFCGLSIGSLRLGLTLCAVLMLLAGCPKNGDEDQYGEPPTSSSRSAQPRSSTPSPVQAEEERILLQYQKFWAETLPRAFAAAAKDRLALLASVTMDPELKLLLGNMAENDKNGETGYGADAPLSQTIERKGGVALVRGCLDSSRAGIKEISSGRKLTRGPARNKVLANLRKGADGIWRVYAVTYPGGSKC